MRVYVDKISRLPDAYSLGSHLLDNCIHNLRHNSAAVLDAAAIFICALIWMRLDELVNDVLHRQWTQVRMPGSFSAICKNALDGHACMWYCLHSGLA